MPTAKEVMEGRLCKRTGIKKIDFTHLIACNLFFEESKFSTKDLQRKLDITGQNKHLRNIQQSFVRLVKAGFLECVQVQSFISMNTKMPALYKITTTGSYVIRDFSGKLKEAVRRLERD